MHLHYEPIAQEEEIISASSLLQAALYRADAQAATASDFYHPCPFSLTPRGDFYLHCANPVLSGCFGQTIADACAAVRFPPTSVPCSWSLQNCFVVVAAAAVKAMVRWIVRLYMLYKTCGIILLFLLLPNLILTHPSSPPHTQKQTHAREGFYFLDNAVFKSFLLCDSFPRYISGDTCTTTSCTCTMAFPRAACMFCSCFKFTTVKYRSGCEQFRK